MRRSQKKKKSYLSLILLVLIGTAAGFIFYKKLHSPKKVEEVQAPANTSVQVNVIEVKAGESSVIQELPARMSAHKIAEIRPQIDGVIVARLFREGSFVTKGQPLYRIDPAEKIIIKAPISGYIGRSLLTDGALVTKSQTQPLAIISQIDQMFADITVPANILEEIKQNKNARVSLIIGDSEYPHQGVIQFSEVSLDQTTDSVVVRATFPNPEEKLISGEMVIAQIHLPQANAITIPQRASERSQDGELFVWVVNPDKTIRKQVITTSKAVGSDWVVTSGLTDGDVIIFEGMQRVNPQSIVDPVLVSRFTGEKIEVQEIAEERVTQAEGEASVAEASQDVKAGATELERTMQKESESPQVAKNEYSETSATAASLAAQKMAQARGVKSGIKSEVANTEIEDESTQVKAVKKKSVEKKKKSVKKAKKTSKKKKSQKTKAKKGKGGK